MRRGGYKWQIIGAKCLTNPVKADIYISMRPKGRQNKRILYGKVEIDMKEEFLK